MVMVQTIQASCCERLQLPLVDVTMSNDVSRPAAIGICKREFEENFKRLSEFRPDVPISSGTIQPESPIRVLFSTTITRLLGRMVHEKAQIYLALPYMAAASALTICVLRFM